MKASDLREARVPVAVTSPESELSEMNQKDQASSVRNEREVDPEEQEHELSEAVKLEGNGVLLSKQSSEESAEEPWTGFLPSYFSLLTPINSERFRKFSFSLQS